MWDKQRNDLVHRVEIRLGGMLLSEELGAAAAGEETTAALVERVRATRLAALGWPPAARALRERVAFLRRELGDEWPDWSDKALLAALDEWLTPYLAGAVGAADLERLDVGMLLCCAAVVGPIERSRPTRPADADHGGRARGGHRLLA